MIVVAGNAGDYVVVWFFVLDLYTNFFSVMLSYKYYHKWYRKVCGCCHDHCDKLCAYCFAENEQDNREVEDVEVGGKAQPKLNKIISNTADTQVVEI